MKALYLKIIIFSVILAGLSIETLAQRSNGLTVEGRVTTEQGSVDGAIIRIYRDGQRMDDYGVGSNGRYKLELNYNYEFELVFERADNFSQKIVVSTRVPQTVLDSDPLFPPFEVDVNLFTEIPDIDDSFSENTVMRIFYSPDVDNFISETYYNSAQIKNLIDQAILQSQMIDRESDYLSALTKAELAELKKEYNELLEAAEEDYSSEQFLDALDGYEAASRIFPDEQYPKDRIAEINDLLGLLMVAEDMDNARAERLQELLTQGDLQYAQLDYSEARNSYNRALSIEPANQHALQRVAEIDDLLHQQQTAEEYQNIIALADNAFEEMLYEEALNRYNEALTIREDESYPRQKISEINQILDQQAQSLQNQESYEQAIFQAEVSFERQFYDKALGSYENALTYKPGDPVATQKIAEIRELMQQLANETLYDKLIQSADRSYRRENYEEALIDYQEALDLFPEDEYAIEQVASINTILQGDENFEQWIAEADAAFENQEYSSSKILYTQALGVYPDDRHALDRVEEIDQILAEQQVTQQYNALIAEADQFFEQNSYEDAIAKYNEALDLRPQENYPEDQIDEINTLLEQIAQANEEYLQTIARADDLYADNQLTEAREVYSEAGTMKPEETYPPEMIREIDAALEEQALLLAEQEAAEQARLEAEALARDEQYQQIIDEADGLVDENELVAAVGKFREAIDVKPEEQYPIVRIEEIRGMIELQREAQEAYDAAIAQADAEFNREAFDAARTAYNEAKQAKPEEVYPDEMLAQIDSIVDTRARLAAEAEAAEQARLAALQAEQDSLYNAAIASAEEFFGSEEYEDARTQYTAALEIKPEEAYPQQQIDEIANRLAALADAQEAYDAAIAQADAEFNREAFDAARTAYNQAKQAKPEEVYPDEMLAQIDSIVDTRARLAAEAEAAEQARLAALQAEQDSLYNAAITSADEFFGSAEYENARSEYTAALEIKPEETYPQQQIDEIANRLAALADAQEAYDAAIAEGDAEFNREAFDAARTAYNQAKQAKPEEVYPDEMLAQIDSIVDTRARLAAEAEAAEQARLAALQAEQDSLFNAAIASADEFFGSEDYENARSEYTAALEMKPEETYPQQQIDEIANRLAALADAQEAYDAAIAQGDAEFNREAFDAARTSYNQAKQAKPEEVYPDEMLAQIDSIVDTRARLAAEAEAAEQARLAALQAEQDSLYNAAITSADEFFGGEEYENARTQYNAALEIKPEEEYPQQQIDEIANRLAALADAQEAYDAAVAQGDVEFNREAFDEARTAYNQAKQAKPEEAYPDEMLAQIDSIVDTRARLAAEAEAAEQARLAALQAEQDSLYNAAITSADEFFGSEEYESARTQYTAALEIKPEETYPQEQIDVVTELLEELAAEQRELEMLNAQYQEAIRLADNFFEVTNYEMARTNYQEAAALKPEEAYPIQKIEEVDQILEQQRIDEEYRNILLAADGHFNTEAYDNARQEYQNALGVKPDEEYPQNQINRIDEILAEQQRQALAEQQAAADMERRRTEIAQQQAAEEEQQIVSEAGLTNLYNDYVQMADEYFDSEQYNVSRAWYYRALDVKPEEPYPPQRIAEINRIVAGLLLSQRDRDYQRFIDLADSTFRDNQLAVARGWYNQALNIKADEAYPREQLAEIENRIEERLAAQSGEQFENNVETANNAFDAQNYNVARFWYKQALELRPDDSEVQARLAEIEQILNQ